MQKNKQAQHKPRRNFAQIHKPRKPSSRFIRHKSAQWWGLDKKGVEGEEGLSKTSPSTPRQSRSYPCNIWVHDGKVL